MGYIVSHAEGNQGVLPQRLKQIEGQVRGLAAWSRTTATASISSRDFRGPRRTSPGRGRNLRDHVRMRQHAIASGDRADQRRKIAELMDVSAARNASGRSSYG